MTKISSRQTIRNYHSSILIELLFFFIGGYMPKIAEISRLVISYSRENWHTSALSIIIGVISPVYRSVPGSNDKCRTNI